MLTESGVYSPRRVAQACEERVDFMAATAMNQPDFRTIAKFRQRHLKPLSDLFVQVLKLCPAAGRRARCRGSKRRTYSPAAIDMAPATNPGTPAIKTSFCVVAAAATPTINLAVEMIP
jgi:hypothetical protein